MRIHNICLEDNRSSGRILISGVDKKKRKGQTKFICCIFDSTDLN
jgi:hypothetical protein